uniref:Uncharacterized protein LOC107423434 isoform X1 n=1 Tax=Rhizophora mucronata TaxID=61149 RepID=A0A2P2JM86_RHIMU
MESSISKRHCRRLLFDRRYGFVIDDGKDPSEEALAGGRGMFCVLPLAKCFLKAATESVNMAAQFAVKVFERPDLFSPKALPASLDKSLNKLMSSIEKTRS